MSFKDHFSGHAGIYRDARPRYPEALFDWLAQQAPTRALAWDAGCGNGQASIALAQHFASVIATDPSARQIAEAPAHANIEYRVEPAEACSLDSASADLVCVAQALHWFDAGAFHAQVLRVLRPRGIFAAWTYADCRVTPAIDALKDRVYVDLTGPYWPPERTHVESGYRDLPFPYEPIKVPAFEMRVDWNVDQFLAYLRSWSAVQRYIGANAHDPVTLLEADLRAAWGDALRPVSWDFHVRCGSHT